MSKYQIDPDRSPTHHDCLHAAIDFICDGGSHDLERHRGAYVAWSNRERAYGRERPDAEQIRDVIGDAQEIGDAIASLLASIGKPGTRAALHEYRALNVAFALIGRRREALTARAGEREPATTSAAEKPQVPEDLYDRVLAAGRSLIYDRNEMIEVWERLRAAFSALVQSDLEWESGSPVGRLAGAVEDSIVPIGNAVVGMGDVVEGLAEATDWLERDLLEDVGVIWRI